ncbi:MAG: hypothetical protein HY598_02410 [Candidatus Omnitrophica bacterium]|nr:hypothetical protein [Candidatus Omnitrophota bacterium]
MADQLELLKQLQGVDGQLHRLRKALAQKPRELEQAAAPVKAQEAVVKTAEEQLRALQLAQKEKEIDLQAREASVKKLQSQLFQVKTNKEYSAMQREIDSTKTDNSLLEEAILKGFDAIEGATKRRQQEQAKFTQLQGQLAAAQARIDQESAGIQQQVAELERARHVMLPDVPPKALAVYERILALRDGIALVPVMKDACGGCNRRLPPQVINKVYLKADLVTCENCNRILYFDDAHSSL